LRPSAIKHRKYAEITREQKKTAMMIVSYLPILFTKPRRSFS